jgi:hypothetical protein
MFTDALKEHCTALKEKDDNFFTDDETVQDHTIALLPLKSYLDQNLDRISLLDLENEMDREDLPDNFSFFEIAYCGHTPSSYARTQMEQALEFLECHLGQTIMNVLAIFCVKEKLKWSACILCIVPKK